MPQSNHPPREYRYYDFMMAAYVCVLLCANLIGPAKVSSVHLPFIGEVTFLARVYEKGQDRSFVERSDFRRVDGAWRYVGALDEPRPPTDAERARLR